jgi:1,2-diacylglycerol 3-alpha-glucosyltransferase
MRILMISDVYFPRVNGVSTSIQTFIDCFQALGHKVTLIAPQYPERVVTTFDLISIPSRALPLDPEDRLMSYRFIKGLRHQLSGRDFDVIHIHTPFVAHYAGIYLAKIFGLKVLATYHTFFEAYFEQYLPWLPKSLLRYLARRISRSQCNQVDTVISPSRQMKDRLLDYGITIPIEVIPTGLPSICFQTLEDAKRYRTNWGIPEDSTVLLYVGRVAFEKNIGLLIDALELLAPGRPDVFLLIAGEGPAEGRLKRYASQRNYHTQIKFTGYLDRADELWRCYQSADCFVFGSQTETQGLVLLEALAAGLPVVSVASMGSKDVLVEGEGCRIVENDPNDFARTLGELIDSPDDLQSLRVKARSYAKCWDAMYFASVLLEVLRRHKTAM